VICRDMNAILISARACTELPEEAREHIETCGQCRTLARSVDSADAQYPVDTTVLDRIRGSVLSSIKPVRLLAPTGVFVLAFLIIFGAAALAGALHFGIYGLPVLTIVQRIAIFSMLFGLAAMAAVTAARSMRPGAQALAGGTVFAITLIAEQAVFLSVFHDYTLGHFLAWGIGCLRSGLLCALPAGLLMWLFLRRGYIVSPVSSGVAIGALSGISGLTALELHCPILTIPHVAIWHVGVVALSTGAGAFAGWIARSR
jgi:Negative regulator of sigma F